MVVADINILCVHQKQKRRVSISNAQIESYSSEHIIRDFLYDDRYLQLQGIAGVWYQIYPQARNKGDYDQEFMDLCVVNDKYKVVFCQESFKMQLLSFLSEVYYESQTKSIYFIVDLQGYKENHLRVSWKSFLEMFQDEKIYFNTVYEICE